MKLGMKSSKKLIYLDHAATTPVRSEVLRAMRPFWTEHFGNPSSLYKQGVIAKQAVEDSRSRVASVLGVRSSEIVFTAGGTESVNLAILGIARRYRESHKTGGHIITSNIEHHAVLRACEHLEHEGFSVTYIPVDKDGLFNPEQIEKTIRKDTILVSLMYANNEIGTIEPIAEIGRLIRNVNANRRQLKPKAYGLGPILFHSDACQAAGFLDIRVHKLGVDLLSLNASKIYGPKQVGCLYVRSGVELQSVLFGGGQEKDLRSGTENVAGVVGFARALELAQKEREKETQRLVVLRDWFSHRLLKEISKTKLNGPKQNRLPNNLNITVLGAEGEALMLYLDAYNISVSTGSACAEESADPSHVLLAIGLSPKVAKQSIRITLGRATTKQELNYVLKVLTKITEQVRHMKTL